MQGDRLLFSLVLLYLCSSFAPVNTDASPVSTTEIEIISVGSAVFAQSCSVGYCHGKAGRAGRGPRLRGKSWDSDYLIKVIEEGIPTSSMAGWKGRLSEKEIRAVVAYIGTLSTLGPNDPDPLLGGEITPPTLSTPATVTRPASQPSATVGDPAKGKALFFDLSDELNCALCHRLNSKGTNVAPDLSGISGRSAKEILKDIILPSAVTTEAGQLFSMTTHDGEQLEVVKVGESSTRVKVYDLTSFPPVLRTIKKEHIQSFELKRPSAMPETYGQRYTLKQLLDIIAFLKSSEGGKAEPVSLTDLF